MQPPAQGTALSEFYWRVMQHHLLAVARPGGLFEDNTVSHLP